MPLIYNKAALHIICMSSELKALNRAIAFAGSQQKLADLLCMKQQGISWWIKKSGRVPVDKAIKIEEKTGGVITRQELRPDIFTN